MRPWILSLPLIALVGCLIPVDSAAPSAPVDQPCMASDGALMPAGTVCRPIAGPCDIAEHCDGVNAACPSDAYLADGASCGWDKACRGGQCRNNCGGGPCACCGTFACGSEEVCIESECKCAAPIGCPSACPDGKQCVDGRCVDVGECAQADGAPSPAGTVCRPAVGPCDVAELCDGTKTSCPADVVAPAGVVCRPAAGACDVAEVCDGTNVGCPEDRVQDNVPSVPCGATLSCLDGQCVDLCALIVCGEGSRCLQGRCMLSCDATQCDSGKTCVEGLCLDTP